MKDSKTLLLEGIEILRKGDEGIDFLIAPNKEKIITTLSAYINEIETFNPAYGLVGTTDSNELVIKHILDSLAPLGIINRLTKEVHTNLEPTVRKMHKEHKEDIGGFIKIADAGSGAGLPGIPLAICLPECDFTLIERMGRRAGFLFNTKAALELSNVNIEENELEKCASLLAAPLLTVQPLTAQFDLITFRAFKPLELKLLKNLQKLLKPGGIIAAYKGKREKIEAEMASLQGAQPIWEAIPYTVPFLDEERNFLVLK